MSGNRGVARGSHLAPGADADPGSAEGPRAGSCGGKLGYRFDAPPQVVHELIGAGRLKPIDVCTLTALLRFRRYRVDSAWSTKGVLGRKINRGRRTVQSSLGRLEACGLIRQVEVAAPDPDEPRNGTGWRIYFLWLAGARVDRVGPGPDRRRPTDRAKPKSLLSFMDVGPGPDPGISSPRGKELPPPPRQEIASKADSSGIVIVEPINSDPPGPPGVDGDGKGDGDEGSGPSRSRPDRAREPGPAPPGPGELVAALAGFGPENPAPGPGVPRSAKPEPFDMTLALALAFARCGPVPEAMARPAGVEPVGPAAERLAEAEPPGAVRALWEGLKREREAADRAGRASASGARPAPPPPSTPEAVLAGRAAFLARLTSQERDRLEALTPAKRAQILEGVDVGALEAVLTELRRGGPPAVPPAVPATTVELLKRIREDPTFLKLAPRALKLDLDGDGAGGAKYWNGFERACNDAFAGPLTPGDLVEAYLQATGPKAKNAGKVFFTAITRFRKARSAPS